MYKRQLLAIYERGRDWDKARDVAARLAESHVGDVSGRLAHYQCELAAQALAKRKDPDAARRLLEQAIVHAPRAARPRVQLADVLASQDDMAGAFAQLLALEGAAPHAVPLVASELVRIGQAIGRLPEAAALLERRAAAGPCIDIVEALVQAERLAGAPVSRAREGYVRHMALEPSLIAATRWLAHEPFAQEGAHPVVQRSLEHAARPLARYRCAACGFETQGYFWQCPGCQQWESFPPFRIEER